MGAVSVASREKSSLFASVGAEHNPEAVRGQKFLRVRENGSVEGRTRWSDDRNRISLTQMGDFEELSHARGRNKSHIPVLCCDAAKGAREV
jgi:hypothetical protein